MTNQLPPGQQRAAPGRWPIVGEREPSPSPSPWTIKVSGAVEQPRSWTLDELLTLGEEEREVDIHCVTRWSMLDTRWTGVPLRRLIDDATPRVDARYVSLIARTARRHSTSLRREDVERLDPLIVWAWQGEPLPVAHGGPVRVVVPGKYFYKSLKWLEEIELLTNDRLGYWEAEAGYHNEADPWREQRFLAADMSRQEAARILAARDLSGLTARGLDASGRDLGGLRAAGAILRDADFRQTILSGADFSGANLSGARFHGADLRGASFRGADVEGVDFRAADLRGADFRGASLFGALLCDDPECRADDRHPVARLDRTTQFDERAFEQLMPRQVEFLRGTVG